MFTLIWINLIAVITSIIAGFLSWREVAKRRLGAVVDTAQSLPTWREPSHLAFGDDKQGSAAVAAHACSLVVIAALLVGAINRAAPSPLSIGYSSPTGEWLATIVGSGDPQIDQISWIAAALAAFVAGNALGSIAAFGLVRAFGPPVTMRVSKEGIWSGGIRLPWNKVASARFDPSRGEILLFTASHPDSQAITLAPPTKEQYVQIESAVRGFVNAGVGPGSATFAQKLPSRVIPLFVLVLTASIVFAVLAYQIFNELIWFLLAVEIVLLSLFGSLFFKKWFSDDFVES